MHCGQFNVGFNRREFFSRVALGLGGTALMGLLREEARAELAVAHSLPGILQRPHYAPRAKRVIYLFMSGGPSQHDLFDHKPLLQKMNGEDLPENIRKGQRLTGMSANQARLPL